MKRLLLTLVAVAVVYVAGFAAYVALLPVPSEGLPEDVDGVAVFTGGQGRVDKALALLDEGFAGPVLISGVHPDVRLEELASSQRFSPAQRARVELDYEALTTRHNVYNTVAWAARSKLGRIGVITSTYHTARSRLLFWLVAPGMPVVMLPVQPVGSGWRTLFREYNKLLLSPVLA